MAKKLYEEEDIREIACALREKCGDDTAKYKCCDMANAIRNLSTPIVEPLTITENGVYIVPTGVDGYGPVSVSVNANTNTNLNEEAWITRKLSGFFMNDNVTTIGPAAFYHCNDLTGVSFPKVTLIQREAFGQCSYLNTISFPLATVIHNAAFYSCLSLTTIHLPLVTSVGMFGFRHCISLTTVDFLPSATLVDDYAFQDCDNLVTVDLPKVSFIGGYVFEDCDKLTTLILRYEKAMVKSYIHSSSTNQYDGKLLGSGNLKVKGYVYVPKALIDTYKTDPYWGVYRFRVLEDYTIDGTTTGALDETKI